MAADRRISGVVSIKDIAAHLGMSHATVSRALNDKPAISEDTKERVRRAALQLGYIPNAGGRLLRGLPSSLVGLIIPDVQNEFYSTTAKILAENCAREGLQLILCISEDDPDLEYRHIRALLEARVAGIVITPTATLRRDSAALLRNTPLIQLVRRHPLLKAAHVCVDDVDGLYMATRHLLELGHRRIAYIGGFTELSTGARRLDGFRKAMTEFAATPDADLIFLGPPRPEFGAATAHRLIDLDRPPTAIVLASSQLATGCLETLHARKVAVPGQLSMVVYGDAIWHWFAAVPISAISLPVAEITNAAAALLFARIRQPAGGSDTVETTLQLSPHLVVRESTAP